MGIDIVKARSDARKAMADQKTAPASVPDSQEVEQAVPPVAEPVTASAPEPVPPVVPETPAAVQQAQAEPKAPKAQDDGDARRKKGGRTDVVQIPAFPKVLIDLVRSEIPNADNRSDALAAWVYVKSGKQAIVPQHIKALAAEYRGTMQDDILSTMLEKLTRIERMSYTAAAGVTDEHYMLEWLLLERMALINSPRIDNMDFTDKVFDQLRAELKQRIQQAKNVQQLRDGRPYK